MEHIIIPDAPREIESAVSMNLVLSWVYQQLQKVSLTQTSTFAHVIHRTIHSIQDRIYPPEYEGHFSRLLIKREEIIERATDLAKAIHNDYKGKRPVLLCVLKGAASFYLHLLEALQVSTFLWSNILINYMFFFFTETLTLLSYHLITGFASGLLHWVLTIIVLRRGRDERNSQS